MAGSYQDAPSRRMAHDTDGTAVLLSQSSSNGIGPSAGTFGLIPWSAASAGSKNGANNENSASYFTSFNVSGASDGHVLIGFVFPELREVDGTYINRHLDTNDNNWAYKSVDTTNGVDGSWVTMNAAIHTSLAAAHYRDNITSMAFAGVKGIKANFGANGTNAFVQLRMFHVYGVMSPGETPDRILFLDTENADATFTKVLDFGDVPRGQTTTRTFKVKNNSASLSINTIQITAEDLYLNAGQWYEFGDGGGSYQATYSIGNLANGAEETIHLKQVIPGGETLGAQAGRIKVSHASVT